MNSRMMISSVFGRAISSLRSIRLGIIKSKSVSTQRNTFSKLRLKICASITSTTEVRSRIYTIVTERFSRQAFLKESVLGWSMASPSQSSSVKSLGSSSGRT